MKKNIFLSTTLLLVTFQFNLKAQIYHLNSPDKQLSAVIEITDDKKLTYRLSYKGTPVLENSRLGYRFQNGEEFPNKEWKLVQEKYSKENNKWYPIWGKRAVVPEKYNQLQLLLKNEQNKNQATEQILFECRLYNEGLAFRYNIMEGREVKANCELTQFKFASDPTAWFYNGERENYGPILVSNVNEIRPANVTLKVNDHIFLNIHEADLTEGDPLQLKSGKGEKSFEVASSPGTFGYLKKGGKSAWRVIMVEETPGELTDSHLLELLNPEPVGDFSWVKPGVAVWDWRINGAQWDGFSYAMDYPSWVRMVDFAAEQGFNYLVLDANWYGPEFAAESDPVTGEKAKDVKRLINYGKEKGVGIWLYLNDVGGRKYSIENTLKQYGDWGAAGVKYGFMNGSPEEKNLWTQKITKLCAENHLLVDFHDNPVHPYGQLRTWPNAVTREFCHAQLDAHRVFSPSTFCTSVFVNMVAGPLDMNNGMFDLRQGKTTRIDENQPVPATLAAEAARTLIVFSGVTILPDIPEYYRKYPSLLDFISAQKMPWKESRTLAGEIGEYIVMMRQNRDGKLLVGAATNEQARTILLPLDFLEKGKYVVEITEDGKDAHYLKNRETIAESLKIVTRKDTIQLNLAPGGGACLLFRKGDTSSK